MFPLRLGFSPCPNDTFMFHALLTGLVEAAGLRFDPFIEDIEVLNRRAQAEELDVVKVSISTYARIRDRYVLLAAGGAVGRGCGPLLVGKAGRRGPRLEAARVAIPGEGTSAALLLRLYAPEISEERLLAVRFDRIPEAVRSGAADYGVIIHETRFTYRDQGLEALVDLGAWWEESEGLPLPLAGIAAHRRLGEETIRALERSLRASVVHALAHPEDSLDYVRRHAQELSDRVTRAHIALYVNHFSIDLGEEGRRAIERLIDRAAAQGLLEAAAPLPSRR